jgi:hypothetical protein
MENMKNQINLLNQLQELILTRDEHHQTGDGSHLDSLNDSIDALVDKLEPQPKTFYQRLYKKDHLVMSPMVDGCCGVCGMRLPVSQVQQVRLARAIQTCSSCGRMLYDEEQGAPRVIAEKPARGEPRKTGVSRFSAEELASHGGTIGFDTRFKLMKKAFAHTAAYDTAIAGFFTKTPWAEVDGTYTQH